MSFNSYTFAIFLPIVFVIYWLLPHKYRWVLLFIASYYFYMSWNAKYVVLILFTTLVSYFAAILLEKQDNKKSKKIILVISTIACLGVLFFFKYFNFVSESVSNFLKLFSIQINPITLKLLLPVGISFYTFQTLSYVIDVYRGDVKAEKHFGYYATFVSFFPQLVAGPIERTDNLLPQIKAKHTFNYNQATYGLKLMVWGFYKKIVVADTLSTYVSIVYDSPTNYSGFALILATFFFAIQIYCDFSGYSDIAIGTSKLFGINLMTNFKSPYFSLSIKEFWNNWHISLSSWFRDYIYIPLGGNRVSKPRHIFNLIVTFLISGLWHGANWTFVIWGGIHGALQSIESFILPKNKKHISKPIWLFKALIVFVVICFTWIFFVSNTLHDSVYVINHLFDGISNPVLYIKNGFSQIGLEKIYYITETSLITLLAFYDYFSMKKDLIMEIGKMKLIKRWCIYIIITLVIIFFSQKGVSAEFVYFQF